MENINLIGQNSHDDLVEAYEDHNIEYLCCKDYNAGSCSSSDCNYFLPNENECELEMGSGFNETFNALFDEDAYMDQLVPFYSIFKEGIIWFLILCMKRQLRIHTS